MKTNFDILEFVQGMTIDTSDHLETVDHYIEVHDKDNAKKEYIHLYGVFTGIEYALEYIEDEEISKELTEKVDYMFRMLKAKKNAIKAMFEEEKEEQNA